MLYEQLCADSLFGSLEKFWVSEALAAARGEPSIVVADTPEQAVADLEALGRCQVRPGQYDLGAGLEPAIYYWPGEAARYACFARWMKAADLASRIADDRAALLQGHFISEQRIVLGRAVLRDGVVSVFRGA